MWDNVAIIYASRLKL